MRKSRAEKVQKICESLNAVLNEETAVSKCSKCEAADVECGACEGFGYTEAFSPDWARGRNVNPGKGDPRHPERVEKIKPDKNKPGNFMVHVGWDPSGPVYTSVKGLKAAKEKAAEQGVNEDDSGDIVGKQISVKSSPGKKSDAPPSSGNVTRAKGASGKNVQVDWGGF